MIWVNFITTSLSPSPGIMVNKGNHPQMAARFRLVKYYNLPRYGIIIEYYRHSTRIPIDFPAATQIRFSLEEAYEMIPQGVKSAADAGCDGIDVGLRLMLEL